MILDDDDPTLETLTVWASGLKGYEVMPFNCPKLALSVLKNSPTYLILTDYQMQSMSGIDFIKSVKTINPQAECIMMTGDGEHSTIVEAMKVGASDFVKKPFDLNNLEATIQRAVARLTLIPTLDEIKKQHIAKCVAVSRTDKEAAEKLGINYSTLYRLKKIA